jgi:hypothetical protein
MTTVTPGILEPQFGGYVKATYDFAEHGGVVGAIPLDLTLPAGAIIYNGFANVVTDPTSGGSATVAISIQGANDLLTATAIASVTGALDLVPDGTAAETIVLTTDKTLTVTVAVAALTAGKIDVYLQYFL